MFILDLKQSFFNDCFRNIFAFFDQMVYSLVSFVVDGLITIANLSAGSEIVNSFKQKIYVILGIYMLFRIAVSLVSSIVNPDSLTDKDRGASKIIVRTIISLMLLIMSPTIFSELGALQNAVISALPGIILGGNVDSDNIGEGTASATLNGFYTPNDQKDCGNSYPEPLDRVGKYFYLKTTTRCDADKGYYAYEYSFLLSTVVGIGMVIILISYTVDTAIRAFKLLILQVLAPIPIMSYIDPKSSKGGAFESWLKTYIQTYTEVFVKLAIFYVVISIVSQVLNGNYAVFENMPQSAMGGFYVNMFLVFGALLFMKECVPFIYKAMGMKYEKGAGILKGLGAIANAGAMGLGALSAIGTGIYGGIVAGAANGETDKGKIAKAALGGFGGAFGGAFRALKSGVSNFDKGAGAIMKGVAEGNATTMKDASEGTTGFRKFWTNQWKNISGMELPSSGVKAKIDRESALIEDRKKAMDFAVEEGQKSQGNSDELKFTIRDSSGVMRTITGTTANSIISLKESAAHNGQSTYRLKDENGQDYEFSVFGGDAVFNEKQINSAMANKWIATSGGDNAEWAALTSGLELGSDDDKMGTLKSQNDASKETVSRAQIRLNAAKKNRIE